ncbi:MAG: bifunctional adenosylcobinamide kinase/adenosylcobinamide-phosphate guanylyltransferase [Clostridiales bacterium]|jgi:adenosylcobinamide kinase/adenosylcobinamide-phosphate guanylyltransferase|nr:bifunctional adenosylcobinamide kinase/adenosylcobinamide-phosphate guanylyltransferase [Clostridiales bacterium]
MIALVTGANNSGKSAFAQTLIERLSQGGPLIYIATMRPYGEEGLSRVKRHKLAREGLGYTTLELPESLAGAAILGDAIPRDAGVLLEDVSNLLANRMFRLGEKDCAGAVFSEIRALAAWCRHLVIVTISGATLAGQHDEETAAYIAALLDVNDRLLALSDVAMETQEGKPRIRKGELP